MKMHNFFFICLPILFAACHSKPKSVQDARDYTGNWRCSIIDSDKICVPEAWEIKEQNKVLFFSYFENHDKNAYFGVIRSNQKTTGLTAVSYLKQYYHILQTEPYEKVIGYTTTKLVLGGDSSVYYSEFHTWKQKSYYTLSMVFNRYGYVYEFALKTDSTRFAENKYIFRDIILKYEHGGIRPFSALDSIRSKQLIDLSKL